MLQDPISKPPDVQLDGASRPPTDRRHKTNANPDQVLKCPRCDSMNTKFCYYNNYSLTQPRHFCKNCRRYWTQGGSLRNVPIGGGCRKNKRVKQRTVDPHSFVSLDESATNAMFAGLGPGGIGGPGGGLLPPGHFVPPPPTFGDLMPNNDSHLLSMAFSRLQESLRLGEQAAQSAGGHHPALLGPNPGKLSLMSGCSMPYDSPALVYNSHGGPPPGHVKAEHAGGVIYSGSDLGSLFDPSQLHLSGAGPPPPGSATATLASLEEQLTSFGPTSHIDAFNIESQIKLQQQQQQQQQNHKQQQQLALHLGGGGAADHMQQQHHPNLPEFEDHESSEVMQMRRQQAVQAAAAAAAGHGAAKAGKMMMGIDWGAPGGGAGGATGAMQAAGATGENMYVQQEQNHGGTAPGSNSDHQGASASFWSHSPWTDVHTLTSSSLMN